MHGTWDHSMWVITTTSRAWSDTRSLTTPQATELLTYPSTKYLLGINVSRGRVLSHMQKTPTGGVHYMPWNNRKPVFSWLHFISLVTSCKSVPYPYNAPGRQPLERIAYVPPGLIWSTTSRAHIDHRSPQAPRPVAFVLSQLLLI